MYDSLWNLEMVIPSIKAVCDETHSNVDTIKKHILHTTLFRGKWYLTNQPLHGDPWNKDIICNQDQVLIKTICNDIKQSSSAGKTVFVFDADTKEFLQSYDGIIQCAKILKISHNTVSKAIKQNGTVRKYMFSAHRNIT